MEQENFIALLKTLMVKINSASNNVLLINNGLSEIISFEDVEFNLNEIIDTVNKLFTIQNCLEEGIIGFGKEKHGFLTQVRNNENYAHFLIHAANLNKLLATKLFNIELNSEKEKFFKKEINDITSELRFMLNSYFYMSSNKS